MNVERLLDDVNLSTILFARSGLCLTLEFLDMRNGNEAGTLVCSGLVFFAYHADPDDLLPQYVGEVNRTEIPHVDAWALLRRLGYRYTGVAGEAPFPNQGKLHHIHIEGGIIVEIVCRAAVFTRSPDGSIG
jgi:hypothetical protein